MTREQMREYIRRNPIDWPALNPTQRMRLVVLLRPDLPVGIRRQVNAHRPADGPRELG